MRRRTRYSRSRRGRKTRRRLTRRGYKRSLRRVTLRRARAGQPTGSTLRNTVSEQRTFKPLDASGNEIKIQPFQPANYINYGAPGRPDCANFSGFRDDFNILKDGKYTLMKDYRLYEKVTVRGCKIRLTLDRPTIMSNGAEIYPTVYLATVCQEQTFQPDPTNLQTTKEFKQFKLTKTGYSAKLWVPALVRERKTFASDYITNGDEGNLDGDKGLGRESGGDLGANLNVDRWVKLPYMSVDDPDHMQVKWGQYAAVVDWGTPPAVGTLTVASMGSIRIEYRFYYKMKNLKYNVF